MGNLIITEIRQVGLSEDDRVYIGCGENRIECNEIKLLSMDQLKEYTNVLVTYMPYTGKLGGEKFWACGKQMDRSL